VSPDLRDKRWLTCKLCKAWALSWGDWLYILQASGLLVAVELGLKLVPLKTLMALLQGRGSGAEERPSEEAVSFERMAYLVEVAARYHVLKLACLQKALVLYRLLQRQRVEVDLVIGVMKAEERLAAHAWLEYRGQVIGGGPVDAYAPLRRFDGGEALARNLERQRQTP
jgi:hypothetical protein